MRIRRSLVIQAVGLALFCVSVQAVQFTVLSGSPEVNADGFCSLFEAIDNANSDIQIHPDCPRGIGADDIDLSGITFNLDGSTLFPASNPIFFDSGNSGLPEIASDITLSNGHLIRTGVPEFRFVVVQSGGRLTLDNVILDNGIAAGNCASFSGSVSGCGGGVLVNNGELVLRDSSIRDGNALQLVIEDVPAGGAIALVGGTLEMTGSTLSGNGAEYGGGIYALAANGTVVDSLFTANAALTSGGGIYSGFASEFVIAGTTFTSNQVTAAVQNFNGGGAIDNAGSSSQLTVVNSDFDTNSARNGGAINNFNASDVYISASRFSGNSASTGGAIMSQGSGAQVNLFSSVVESNMASFRGGGVVSGNFEQTSGLIETSDFIGNSASSHGGGIVALGMITVVDTLFDDNSGVNGGGIYVGSGGGQTVTVDGGQFIQNMASGNGGGIYVNQNPSSTPNALSVLNSIFDGNAADEGGGVYADYWDVLMASSSFTGNSAVMGGFGGGGAVHIRSFIVGGAAIEMNNLTISGNTALQGGGLYFNGSSIDASLSNLTIVNNAASSTNSGDGIQNVSSPAAVTIRDSILGSNDNRNCIELSGFGVTDGGDNISDDASCGFADNGGGVGDGVDPKLGVLADNGGGTLTHELLAASPAIDEGSVACAAVDQRGAGRFRGCDIGAFETVTGIAGVFLSVDRPVIFEFQEGVATVTVTVANRAANAQTVDLELRFRTAGNASGLGFDYVMSGQNGVGADPAGQIAPLSFSVAPGATERQSIIITAVDDSLVEADESVLLSARIRGFGAFVDSDSVSVTIRSDDVDVDALFSDSFESL